MFPIEKIENNAFINIKLSPNAKKDSINSIFINHEEKAILKISVTKIPEKNKANKALIKMLSKFFKISKNSFTIISGITDKNKRIKIEDISKNDYDNMLTKLKEVKIDR